MSVEYALIARKKLFSVKLSAEVSGVRALRYLLPAQVRLVFGGPDGERAPRAGMLSAVRELIRATEEHRGKIGCTYKHASEADTRPDTGMTGGLRLPGDDIHYYTLVTGAGECLLRIVGVGEDGRGEYVGEIDIRNREHVDTVNMGCFTIAKEDTADRLLELLHSIEEFLESIEDEWVVKTGG